MSVVKQITEIFKKVPQFVWNVATLQYFIDFMVSHPIQFLVSLPVVGPLALVLSLITVFTVGGVVFIASGLVLLIVMPLSGPIAFMALIVCLCYIVYKTCLAVINYLYKKFRTLYATIYEKVCHKVYGTYKQLFEWTRTTVQNLRDVRDKVNTSIHPRAVFSDMHQKCNIFQGRCLQIWALLLLRLQQWKAFFLDSLALSIDKVADEVAQKPKQVDPNSGQQKMNSTKGEEAPTKPSVKRVLPPSILTKENMHIIFGPKRRYRKSHSYVPVDVSAFTPRSKEI